MFSVTTAIERSLVWLLLPWVLAGCASDKTSPNSWFGGNAISVVEAPATPPQQSYAVTLRLSGYQDQRATLAANQIGSASQIVIGMSGHDLRVEPEVASIVGNAMRRQLVQAGYRLVEEQPQYELSGVIRKLRYDVKVRDEVEFAIESTLKEVATGKVVWSGVVEEKRERFAGVSGNSKQDIANYLRERLNVVVGKTVESINGTLMATRPELFNLTPGTRPVAGVTVLAAPAAVVPVQSTSQANTQGHLLLTSKPTRAKVHIDGIYYGLTPLRLELAAGIHEVGVQMDGYREHTEKVSIRQAETTELETTLRR